MTEVPAALVNLNITHANPSQNLKEVDVTVSDKFTPLPKIREMMALGIDSHVVGTYAALADYANNTTGECYPRMTTLSRTLGKTPRTIQSHLYALRDAGLVEFKERRRDRKGRFQSWVYRLPHVAAAAERIKSRREKNKAAYEERKRKQKEEKESRRRQRLSKKPSTGSSSPVAPNKGLTSSTNHLTPNPQKDRTEGYWWFFGEEAPPDAEEQHHQEAQERREAAARRRREGFDWLF